MIALVVALLVAWAGIMELLGHIMIHRRPEVELCREFLLSNSSVREHFGELSEVKYARRGARVKMKRQQVSGVFTFEVLGSEGTGKVRVSWKRQTEEDGFRVVRVSVVQRFGRGAVIWQATPR